MPNPPRIKIVTGYDGDCPWRDLLEANLTEYCGRWSYALRMKFDGWKPIARSLMWRKVQLIQEELYDCDWLLWLDADCFILNMTIPITQYVSEDYNLGVTGPFPFTRSMLPSSCPLLLGTAYQCYSAGILLIRNCEWIHELLR